MKYAACSNCRQAAKPRQRGAVLVLALLIMSLVAALAVYMAGSFELTARKAGNRLTGTQNLFYIQSAEVVARHVLRDDDAERDYLEEAWAQPLTFAPEGDEIAGDSIFNGYLEDARSRFNLNALKDDTDREGFTGPQKQFIRLLQTFEDDYPVTEQEARLITEAVMDWLDADDSETGPGGAESLYYSGFGYRPPNSRMHSVSELRQVRHITPELFELLRPYCVVLPDQNDQVNINTASARLMRSINGSNTLAPLDEADGEELANTGSERYDDTSEFLDHPVFSSLQAGNTDTDAVVGSFAVNSDYFILHSEVWLNKRVTKVDSLIDRTDSDVRVVSRSWGRL